MSASELKGSIRFMSLGMLISLNCNEQRTIRVEIETQKGIAELFIEKGNIVHATFNSEVGKPAFQEIIALKDGIFNIYPDEIAPITTIHENWSKLLFEFTRLQDEAESGENKELDWSDFPLIGAEDNSARIAIDERLERMVKSIQRIREVQEVIVISNTQEVLKSTSQQVQQKVIENVQKIQKRCQALGKLVGANLFLNATFKSSKSTHIINRGQDTVCVIAEAEAVSETLLEEIYLIMKRYR